MLSDIRGRIVLQLINQLEDEPLRSGPLFFSVATLLIASCGGGGGSGGPGGSGAQNGDDIGRTPGCFFADYPRAKTSEYVLPFQVGMTYPLGQGNCGRFTHQLECFASGRPCGDHRYSYDFQMPIGTVALAARSGEITSVVMRFADGNRTGGQANYISIRHDDGSVGRYLHLSFSSAMVMVGQRVLQGDPIALSSDTGIADGDRN